MEDLAHGEMLPWLTEPGHSHGQGGDGSTAPDSSDGGPEVSMQKARAIS